MSNTNHDFLVKNGLVVGQAITSTGTLTQAGQTFPASDGSAGQYLKTNGSGALSWGTVSTSFNITDGTTTDTVGLTETVTFTGGTNISLAVTDNTVTITNDVVDSDDITEGSSNLFYTDARAIAAIQGASNLTIDGGTLYVDTAADRVGISDTSPQQKLDVAGNIGVNGSEVIDASGNIVGSVADSAMTVGGSLAGVLSNLKVQYGTSYSGTPIQGSFFFDSLNQKLKVYTGSAFIDAVPAGSGGGGGGGATDANTTFRNYSYTLTGTTSAVSGVDDNELTAGAFIIGHKYTITSVGNTDFTAIGASGNTVGVVFTATGVGSGTGQAKSTLFYDTTSSTTRVVAYVNGIKQVYGSGRDFVATTGTSVAFTYNLGSGDTVDIQVYELLTNDAYYLKSEVYTQTEVNSQISTGVSSYLPLAGGTLTGHVNGTTFGSGISTPVAIGGTPADLNSAEVGPGYINLARDDTAAAAQIRFAKNGSIHSYLETRTNGLGFITNVGDFGFEGGNVGIGTSSPGAVFHVNRSSYSSTERTMKINNGGNNAGAQYDTLLINQPDVPSVRLVETANNQELTLSVGNENSNSAVIGSTGQLVFAVGRSASTLAYSAGGRAMTINSLGNVGIGVTDPDSALEVQSASGGNNSLHIANTSSTGYGAKFLGGGNTATRYIADFRNYSGVSKFKIDGDGKVGIGTTNPQAILSLNGGSTCTQTFQSSWSSGTGRISFVGGSSGVDGSGATSTGAKIESLNTAPGGAATGDLKFIVNSGDHFETGIEITHQGTVRLALQGTHTTIGSNSDDRAPYGYSNITANNHADILWGFNSRLITGGGGHDYEVVNSHGSINNSGIMLTGNGNPESPNNILFFANGGSATAGTVYSPSNRKFTMNSGGSFVAHNGSGGAVIRLANIGGFGGVPNHYIELSSNLPGYTNGLYNCLKTSMNDLHFVAGNTYTGYISYNGGFADISDQSLKENVVTIDGALSKVEQLQGRYFTWISEDQSDDRQIGFIAQEVEAVIPELVTTSGTGIKGISYGKTTALLVEAIKEQQTLIEQLQARLTAAGI